MAGDVLKKILRRTQASESTDLSGLAQLLVYVHYVYGGSIKEDILFWKQGDDLFKVQDSFVTSNGLWWSRCVDICTDRET